MKITCVILVILNMLLLTCADYDLLEDSDKKPGNVDLEIIAATDSSVTLRWTQCREDGFKKYEVYYGTNDIVDRNDRCADSLTFSVDTVKTVQLLDDQTQYYFRILVYNEQDNFAVSNIVDTITLEDFKGKLKLRAPVFADNGGIVLHWTTAREESDRYIIYGDTLRDVDTTDTIITTVYSDTTETITGLLTDHTWWLRVYAWRDMTIVATSNTVEINVSSD